MNKSNNFIILIFVLLIFVLAFLSILYFPLFFEKSNLQDSEIKLVTLKDLDKAKSPSDGLVLYLPMNGNVVDRINGLNGDVAGELEIVEGIRGQALNFDGEKSRISVPFDKNLKFDDELTVSAWIKIKGDNFPHERTSDWQTITHGTTLEDGWWGVSYWLALTPNIDGLRFSISGEKDIAKFNFETGRWYHIVATYDGLYKIIYVDGNKVYSKLSEHSKIEGEHGVNIGYPGTNPYPFYGVIDEVKVYNQVLSEEEIKELYLIS